MQLDAGPGFINYEWQDGTLTQTYLVSSSTVTTIQYSVTTIDSNGCSTSDDVVVDFEICPSTNNFDFAKGISYHPNPINSSGQLQINSQDNFKLEVEILTVTGKCLYKIPEQNKPFTIVMNNFSSGLYFIKITDSITRESFTGKLLIE